MDSNLEATEQGIVGATCNPASGIVAQLRLFISVWHELLFRVLYNLLTFHIAHNHSHLALDIIIQPINLAFHCILYSVSLPVGPVKIVLAICGI